MSRFITSSIFFDKETALPLSNKIPLLLSIIVSFEPPILLAIIGYLIDCASTETLPKDSGSIEDETIISDNI